MTFHPIYSNTPVARLVRAVREAKVEKETPLLLLAEASSPEETLQLDQLQLKTLKPQLREARAAERKILEHEKRRADMRLKRRQQAEQRAMCGSSAAWHREGERQADKMRSLISKIELFAAIAERKRIREAEAQAAAAKAQAEAKRKAARIQEKQERDIEYLSDPGAMAKHLARAAKRAAAPQATV